MPLGESRRRKFLRFFICSGAVSLLGLMGANAYAMSNQVLIALVFAAVLIAGVALVRVVQLSRRIHAFFQGRKGADLEGLLAEMSKHLREVQSEFTQLRNDVARIDVMAGNAVQKVGVVRFNPFAGGGMGSDQSFAIAILDFEDNGVVLSSLHGREGTRIYAKPIVKGESKHHLSDEENEAIRRALQGE